MDPVGKKENETNRQTNAIQCKTPDKLIGHHESKVTNAQGMNTVQVFKASCLFQLGVCDVIPSKLSKTVSLGEFSLFFLSFLFFLSLTQEPVTLGEWYRYIGQLGKSSTVSPLLGLLSAWSYLKKKTAFSLKKKALNLRTCPWVNMSCLIIFLQARNLLTHTLTDTESCACEGSERVLAISLHRSPDNVACAASTMTCHSKPLPSDCHSLKRRQPM